MTANVRDLKPKQQEAIVALMSHQSVEDAARAVNMPVRTLHRWLKEPAFDAAYLRARRDAYKQGIARLQKNVGAAISILFKVMADVATPAAVKVRAVECVLSHSSKAIEIEDIEARVAALESAAQEAPESRR